MSESCNHNCGGCSANCSSRTAPQSFLVEPNKHSNIRKIIGIVSGKGGVGKSSVTSLLAVAMRKRGYRVGIIDADITGPSIPNMFNIHTRAKGCEDGILPEVSSTGIEVMSMNLLLDREDESVIYRGPVVAGIVKQFYTDVIWEDIDYLFVDMPPGTGDVPLTVFQSYPLDGIVIVSTPQSLVSMIVSKACDMATKMNVSVLGLVENMSYVKCPDCGKKLDLFPTSHVDEIASQYELPVLAKLPMMSEVMQFADEGRIEEVEMNYLNEAANELEALMLDTPSQEIIAIPSLNGEVFGHFGKSEEFTIVTIVENQATNFNVVKLEEQHGAIPGFLASQNVSTVLAGGMGEGAYKALVNNGIRAIRGVDGSVLEVVDQYIMGNLVDSAVECHHDHEESNHQCNCGGGCHH